MNTSAKQVQRTRLQLTVFAILLAINALSAFLIYALGLHESMMAQFPMPEELASVPPWVIGAANAGIVVVLYGLLGTGGYWFARRFDLPGVYQPGGNWRQWLVFPAIVGGVVGLALVGGDLLFTSLLGGPGFPHPEFPLSILASATAGIGEEILFRMFVFGLWAFLLSLVFRSRSARPRILLAANIIAALAFGAGHMPQAMIVFDVTNPIDLGWQVLTELFLLNAIVGLTAGVLYMRHGLVAAIGVHFWADIVWHVLWPLL